MTRLAGTAFVAWLLLFTGGCASKDMPQHLRPLLDQPIVGLAISPNQTQLAAITNPPADAQSRGILAVWDLKTEKLQGRRELSAGLSSILFEDDETLLIGTVDGAVMRVEVSGLKTTKERASSRGAVTSLGQLPGSRQFLVGHLGGDVQRLSHELQDLGELEMELASPVVALLPESSGDTVVYLCWDGTWGRRLVPERASAAPLSQGKLEGVLRSGLLLSANLLATAGPGEDVAIVDLDRGRVETVLRGDGAGDVMAICPGKSGEIIAASRPGIVRRWDCNQRLKVNEVKLEKQIHSLATIPDEGRWFAGDEIGAIHFGNFSTPPNNQ